MIDKVQKILSEIATRKLCTMDEHMAFYNDKAKEDYRLLSEIEELIKALQEESKECMYSKDNYTGEDRKVLCDDCEEECKFNKKEEPVSEELIEELKKTVNIRVCVSQGIPVIKIAHHFAQWQKEQIIKRLRNHANIDQMVEKFEAKYKPQNVIETECYKRGIFDAIKAIKEE